MKRGGRPDVWALARCVKHSQQSLCIVIEQVSAATHSMLAAQSLAFALYRDTGMFAKMEGSQRSAAENWQAEKAALLQQVCLSCHCPKRFQPLSA